MREYILAVIAVSSSILAFVQFIVNRYDKKKEENSKVTKKLDEIDNKLCIAEKDSCRTQLLLLMSCYSDNIDEIMRVAKHYFKDLHGNWYATTLFLNWLHEKKLPTPNWLDILATSTK